ncbi:MAG: hypothetical protein ACYDFU_06035 [Nitrospirota bacterium]
MKKFLIGLVGFTLFAALPLMARADMLSYQGKIHRATVFYQISGVNTSPVKVYENITSSAPNVSFTFDNASGIVSQGQMSFNNVKGNGMWIGFGGTALSPTANMVVGNLQVGGVVIPNGSTVTYDIATNTYTGTGKVIEFVGTGALYGMLKKGWDGQYGTPGAGPGGGWMPAFGNSSTISAMPGWGGSTSNWGMLGGYGGVGMTGNSGMGGFTGGGGMMTGNGSGSFTMGGSGSGNMGGGMGSGMGSGMGGGSGQTPMSGGVGMLRMFIAPIAAAEISVANGTPDTSAPVPVHLKIMLPAIGLSAK